MVMFLSLSNAHVFDFTNSFQPFSPFQPGKCDLPNVRKFDTDLSRERKNHISDWASSVLDTTAGNVGAVFLPSLLEETSLMKFLNYIIGIFTKDAKDAAEESKVGVDESWWKKFNSEDIHNW